jgi:23S rRNA pseudouridine1911/1915/1917 synthase
MADAFSFTVPSDAAKQRLDKALSLLCITQSRQYLQKCIKDGHVRVNNTVCTDPAARVSGGDGISLTLPNPTALDVSAQTIPLVILYEDDHLLVLDKSAGMVVHPAAGNADNTLVNALLAHCGDSLSGIGGVRRPGIVHRLDKDTSGIMVIAKSDGVHQHLSQQFQDRSLTRLYTALIWGHMPQTSVTIHGNIGRHPRHRQKMTVLKVAGKPATTNVTLIKYLPHTTLVTCQLLTGRTHQIRVHLSHHGYPLIGDPHYARRLPKHAPLALQAFPRQALHAHHLGFTHPITKAWLSFDTPLPHDFQQLLASLESLQP